MEKMNNSIKNEFLELKRYYPRLNLKFFSGNYCIITGDVRINAIDKEKNIHIIEDFNIEIKIDSKYPKNLPVIKNLSDNISKEFEHVNQDGTLCLGVNLEAKLLFYKNSTLLNWFNTFVVTFFYNAKYFEKYGGVIAGERKHYTECVVDALKEILNLEDVKKIVRLMKIRKSFKTGDTCICGSKKKIKDCHLKQLVMIKDIDVSNEIQEMKYYLREQKTKKRGEYVDLRYPYSTDEYERIIIKIQKKNMYHKSLIKNLIKNIN
jgi:hypothetical protein